MINNIQQIVKGEVARYISGAASVPCALREQTILNASNAIMVELKRYAQPQNMPSFMSLLSPEMSGTQFGATSMLQDMQDSVVVALIKKEGFEQPLAEGIAVNVIPAVVTMLAERVADPRQPEFSVESLADALVMWRTNCAR